MKKLKIVVEVTDENFEVLKNGNIGDFDDPSNLIADLSESVTLGQFEEVE